MPFVAAVAAAVAGLLPHSAEVLWCVVENVVRGGECD
jgi:hypothetical protein